MVAVSGKNAGMLVRLGIDHGAPLERFLRDWDSEPENLHGYFCGRDWMIDRVVHALDAWAEGRELNEGWVPCTTRFWEDDGELQGVINIRHHLSPGLRELGGHIGYSVAPSHRRNGVATSMLRAALGVGRQLGIGRALLTVDRQNEASWRAIERNGGVLECERQIDDGSMQRWYWINIS